MDLSQDLFDWMDDLPPIPVSVPEKTARKIRRRLARAGNEMDNLFADEEKNPLALVIGRHGLKFRDNDLEEGFSEWLPRYLIETTARGIKDPRKTDDQICEELAYILDDPDLPLSFVSCAKAIGCSQEWIERIRTGAWKLHQQLLLKKPQAEMFLPESPEQAVA